MPSPRPFSPARAVLPRGRATPVLGLAALLLSLWTSTAPADFSHTLSFAGSAGLFIGGVEQSGWSMSSASGIDWLAAAPVPEPGSWALLLAGLGLLGLRRSRA